MLIFKKQPFSHSFLLIFLPFSFAESSGQYYCRDKGRRTIASAEMSVWVMVSLGGP